MDEKETKKAKAGAKKLGVGAVVIIAVVALLLGCGVGMLAYKNLPLPGSTAVFNGATTISEDQLDTVIGSYTYNVPTADAVLSYARYQIISKEAESRGLSVSDEEMDSYAQDELRTNDYATIASTYSMTEDQVKTMIRQAALMKKLHLYRDHQRDCSWQDEGPVVTLRGARVLVVGAGDLGLHFAQLCHALGASCVGVRRNAAASDSPAYREAFSSMHATRDLRADLPALLPAADVVACFLPSTPQTRNLADASFFQAMRPGSYFVNAGRGDLVDQDALCDALESGHLAGATIDVTSPEPLPADSRLWIQKNALVTPHVAGFWHLPVTRENVRDLALENLRRYARGEELRNVVEH